MQRRSHLESILAALHSVEDNEQIWHCKDHGSYAREEILKQKVVADSVDFIGGILLESSAAKCCATPS